MNLTAPREKKKSVRYLRIANQGGNVVLHRYANYPGQFSYDLLAGNCNDGFSSIFCVQEERGVVSVHKIEDVPASSDLIIRIVEEKILYDVDAIRGRPRGICRLF